MSRKSKPDKSIDNSFLDSPPYEEEEKQNFNNSLPLKNDKFENYGRESNSSNQSTFSEMSRPKQNRRLQTITNEHSGRKPMMSSPSVLNERGDTCRVLKRTERQINVFTDSSDKKRMKPDADSFAALKDPYNNNDILTNDEEKKEIKSASVNPFIDQNANKKQSKTEEAHLKVQKESLREVDAKDEDETEKKQTENDDIKSNLPSKTQKEEGTEDEVDDVLDLTDENIFELITSTHEDFCNVLDRLKNLNKKIVQFRKALAEKYCLVQSNLLK